MRLANLYHGVPAAAIADVYVAPAGGASVMVAIAANNTGAAAAVTLQRVPTVGAAQSILNAKSVPANDYHRLQGPIRLEAGEKLAARNHTAAAITLLVVGLLAD